MAKGKPSTYQDERTGDEGFDEILEKESGKEGHWRPPYGLIAALCVLFLLLGFGGGFGAGWAAKPSSHEAPQAILESSGPNVTLAPANTDILLSFQPLNFQDNLNNQAVQKHYEQSSVLNPALNVLTMIISTLGRDNNTYDPNVVRIYLYNRYLGQQDTLAKFFNIAQRLQIADFGERIYDIATSLVDVFNHIRDNMGSALATGGRRLMAANSAEPLAVQLVRAFIKAGLQAPELQGARQQLGSLWPNEDDIIDLVADMYDAIRDVAAQTSGILEVQNDYHPSLDSSPPVVDTVEVGGKSVKVIAGQAPPLIVGEVGDDILEGPSPDTSGQAGSHRRHLLDNAQLKIQLPPGFVPALPASQPNVLIPTVWHIMAYKNADGTFGPPGLDTACDMIQRMVIIANYRLAPSKFQLFVKECRNNPANRAYLLKDTRDAWLACTTGAYFHVNCGSIIPDSIADFPRSINFYVAGEQPPTSWAGYAWVPGSTDWPMDGHIGITWTAISTLGNNNRGTYEAGSNTLVHEVLHHLGMDHTFSTVGCSDADSGKGVSDTPITVRPVWNQTWSMQAAMACMNVWNRALSTNWDTANRQASTRVGITDTESNTKFDSCPGGKPDELANYITYTYDICMLALGHLTTGQISAMHQITADNNPTLYAWGQYYAANPPAGANQIAAASSSSPPPPPPPPPPTAVASPPPAASSTPPSGGGGAACQSTTARRCRCQSRWYFQNTWFSDCTTVPGYDRGTWCAVDLSTGDCANPRNGWWDSCTPACPSGGGGVSSPPPSPPPPSPPPPSPPPTTGSNAAANCGPGAPTKSGLVCTSNPWKIKNSDTQYMGCANPTNDVNGPWCVLVKGTSTVTGALWDYCLDGCKASTNPGTTNTGTVATPNPYPSVLCAANFANLPDSCTCQSSYTMTFEADGTAYYRQTGCTAFKETGGAGMCMLTCTNSRRNNNKAAACGCA